MVSRKFYVELVTASVQNQTFGFLVLGFLVFGGFFANKSYKEILS